MKNFLRFIALAAAAVMFVSCPNGTPEQNVTGTTPVITIVTQPAAETNVTAGAISGNLTVAASVTAGATLSYQWFSNTTASNAGGTAVSGATEASFVIPTGLGVGTHYYFVEVRASGGAAPARSAVATVTVIELPPVEMVWVPGGVFELGQEMGTAGSGNVNPVSTVTLSGFYMSRFPVTQAQFLAVMGFNPSYFSSNPAAGEVQGRRPVENVSWHHAIVFANRLSIMSGLTPAYAMPAAVGGAWTADPDLWGAIPDWGSPLPVTARWNNVWIVPGSTGYRLPTEAQWEFAAKGGANPSGNFTFAGSNNANAVTWHNGNSGGRTREVGRLDPNCLGFYDMSGNVWEWVWDRWGDYTSEPKEDPVGPDTGTGRVLRGGSWSAMASDSRSVNRFFSSPGNRNGSIGFRLARP